MGEIIWEECLADIQPRKREWLWDKRIPLGELTLIAGSPGLGKSLITIKMAHHITTGADWPDGSKCIPGGVILFQAEDTSEDTIRPRCDAAGVNAKLVRIVHGAVKKKELVQFELKRDIEAVIGLIKQHKNIRAIIIDPIGSYVGDIDVNRENQVRNVMYALKQKVAGPYRVAIIIVVHLRKGGTDEPALSRILGSVAFIGCARQVWGVAGDPDVEDRRMFIPMKHNLTKGARGCEFFIDTASNDEGVARWGKEISVIACDAMQDHGTKAASKSQKTEKIIREALADGPQPEAKVKEQVIQEDIGDRTLGSVKRKLGVVSRREGGIWMWSLP